MDETSLWIAVIVMLAIAAQGADLSSFGLFGAIAIAGWFIVGEQAHH